MHFPQQVVIVVALKQKPYAATEYITFPFAKGCFGALKGQAHMGAVGISEFWSSRQVGALA